MQIVTVTETESDLVTGQFSLYGKVDTIRSREELDEKTERLREVFIDADDFIANHLVTLDSAVDFLPKLSDYIETYGNQVVVNFLESRIAQMLNSGTCQVSMPLFIFLSEISSISDSPLLNEDLAYRLEIVGLDTHFAHLIKDDFFELINSGARMTLHRLLSFFRRYQTTYHSRTYESLKEENIHPEIHGGVTDLFKLVYAVVYQKSFPDFIKPDSESDEGFPVVDNYLLHQDMVSFVEAVSMYSDQHKDSRFAGVPGGNQDGTKFLFERVEQSYYDRIRLGIFSGYPIKEPLIRVSPDLYGSYVNGSLRSVYQEEDKNDPKEIERDLIAQNDPRDTEHWKFLNQSFNPNDFRSQSNKLGFFRELWDFRDRLKKEGRSFYFDLSVLHPEMHPYIRINLLTYNQEVIQREIDTSDSAKMVSQEDFTEEYLGFSRGSSVDSFERYKVLSSFEMRRKVERDFGIDISEQSPRTQHFFLEYLERQSIGEVGSLQMFSQEYRDDGFQTFLALEHDESLGDGLVALGNHLSEQGQEVGARAIFKKYAEIVDVADKVEAHLAHTLPKDFKTDQAAFDQIRSNLLRRGKNVLTHFTQLTESQGEVDSEAIQRDLDIVKSEILLAAASFRELQGSGLELKDLAQMSSSLVSGVQMREYDKECGGEVVTQMRALYAQNYADKPGMQQALLAGDGADMGFDQRIEDPHTDWSVLTHGQDVVGFFALTQADVEDHPEQLFLSSFNVSGAVQGGRFGDAMIHDVLDQKSSDHIITAGCDGDDYSSAMYIERGFIAVNVGDFHEVENALTIVRNDSQQEMFRTKVDESGQPVSFDSITESETVKIIEEGDGGEFELLRNQDDGKQWVLTRYQHKTSKSKLVYEQVSSGELDKYRHSLALAA